MRPTSMMAAAVAATVLLLPGGALPRAEASGAGAAAGRWNAREAAAFWTPERMASAVPVPDPATPVPEPAATPAAPSAAPSAPAALPIPVPVPIPAVVPLPGVIVEPTDVPPPEPAVPDEPVAPTPPPPPPSPSPSADAPAPRPARPPAAPMPAGAGRNFDGTPVVGRMFAMKGSGAYFCTASVVSSAGRNLVISAAHCLLGTDTRQVAFVPRYTKAKPRPYGMFPVVRDKAGRSKVWIHQRYRTEGVERAATLDVAFAQVGPDASGRAVEKVVGGNRLVTGATYAHPQVTLIGHPAAAARPRICVNRTTKFTSRDAKSPGSFLRIDCTGFPGGTSGGPFLARYDARRGTGDVVGVIGGWKTGGPTADTSYSPYFGAEIRKLYQTAVAGARVA
ncbi:serine protease [Streptomyces sp. RerS4]|uniref:trypsin-like peptidase domain-containing protein n=1 Tax=Streptomyces sp. RerS4 TaxID=2942449 RepID=UPI00201C1051|nr:serine protease [Streptomyces sp. RerS4]UQX04341.1 trypsin-like peptidase domain-containing protein [Streptomyces sp. RerS4]